MTQLQKDFGGAHGDGHDEPHVTPVYVYVGVWLALVVLTALTVAVSRVDLGSANTVVALVVATIKAALVVLFFMHLLYDDKFNLVVLLASLLFVTVFFTPTLIDLSTRGMLDPLKTREGYKQSLVKRSDQPPPPPEPVRLLPPVLPAQPSVPTEAVPASAVVPSATTAVPPGVKIEVLPAPAPR